MTTAAQLLIATILNFLGMAPEAQELAAPVKAEIFVEDAVGSTLLTNEGKICYHYRCNEAGDTY